MTPKEIAKIKKKAKQAYLDYQNLTGHLDCGHALAQHIVAGAGRKAREFDALMEKLVAIDPDAPKTFSKLTAGLQ